VAAAKGVLMPMACGLGGDAFVLLYDARRGEVVAFNGSGVAAAGATREYYTKRGFEKTPLEGVHSVSVPGALSVYEAVWKRHGSRPWPALWAPAIGLAEEGVAITERVARRIADRAELLARHVHSAAQFLPNGRPPAAGQCWSAPNLARSLRVVARDGAESFYRGELAKALLDFLALEGAVFEADDFARQEAATYERSRPTTAASPSTGRPRRLKDSCCWNSSTSWKASTCGRSIPSAPSGFTCWSRQRSWPSPTATRWPATRPSWAGP